MSKTIAFSNPDTEEIYNKNIYCFPLYFWITWCGPHIVFSLSDSVLAVLQEKIKIVTKFTTGGSQVIVKANLASLLVR